MTETRGRTADAATGRGARIREISAVLIDLVVPIAGFYLLRGVGLGAVLALLLASSPTALFCGYQLLRRRRLDWLAVFVLVILAASVGLSFITASPRFLLAKESWLTAAIGIAFLVSLGRSRPLVFTLARTLLERTGLAARFQVDSWDRRWHTEPWFRRVWRTATVIWAVGLLVDAAVRVVMAETLPIDVVPGLAGALWGVTFLALQVIQHAYFTRTGLWRTLTAGPPVADAGRSNVGEPSPTRSRARAEHREIAADAPKTSASEANETTDRSS